MWPLDWLLYEEFWLPEGFTWEDFKSTPDFPKPNLYDLRMVPPLAVLLFLVRVVFERFLATPFCHYLGIKDVDRKMPEENAICDKVYKLSNSPSKDRVDGLSKQLGWSSSRVRRWFRRRRNVGKPKLLRKATESCWRSVIYLLLFIHEAVVLLPTGWFYDMELWFAGFIKEQSISDGIRWLNIFQLSFYFSLMVSQFADVKRKDFWQMFLHHIITVWLIGFSYVSGHFRVGAVIMMVHDVSDVWLEAAKVSNYAQMQRTCDTLFVIFAIVFYISRWFFYPVWILRFYIFESYKYIGWYQSYYFLMGCLCCLQVLHIFWGFSIARVVYQFAVVGKVEKDVRSEDEESTDEDKDGTKKKEK